MISPSSNDFMTDCMKININSINDKLNEPFFIAYRDIAIDAIDKSIKEIKKSEVSGAEQDFFHNNEASKFICSYFCELVKPIKDDKIIQVFEALRMAFTHYACGGLYQLYTKQENGTLKLYLLKYCSLMTIIFLMKY